MNIKPIITKKDYQTALKRVEKLWNSKPKTQEGNEFDVLVTLVSAYEDKYFPISLQDPVEAIKFRMDQLGLKNSDLKPYIGTRDKVSEILNRRRPLSLAMIRKLSNGLNIPVENLICEYTLVS